MYDDLCSGATTAIRLDIGEQANSSAAFCPLKIPNVEISMTKQADADSKSILCLWAVQSSNYTNKLLREERLSISHFFIPDLF